MKLIDDTTIQVRSIRTHRVQRRTICPNCRLTCDVNSNFCGHCGLDLNEGTSALRAIHPMQVTQTEVHTKSKKLPLTMLVGLGVLLICFIVATSWFAFSHAPSTSSVSQTRSSQVATKPTGKAWFYSNRSNNDGVAVHINSLPKVAKGKVYVLWLINPLRPNQVLSIGPLLPDSHNTIDFHSGSLTIAGSQGQSLHTLFSRVAITIEPSGKKWIRPSSPSLLQTSISST